MQNRSSALQVLVAAALLAAVGIAIPMFSPVKLVIPPASYTLASHVPIFMAMFISPAVGVAVALMTTMGFFLGGFPLVIVMRALTHVVWAGLGAWYLQKNPQILATITGKLTFSALLATLHGLLEVVVVMPFFYAGGLSPATYTSGFFTAIVLLVGVGTIAHSMVDFAIAHWIWRVIAPQLVMKTAVR
jgi:niacin transporter